VRRIHAAIGAIGLLAAVPVSAGTADVIEARLEWLGDRRARVHATVEHADEGWSHYADRFDVLGEDGTVLTSRVLAHPHVHEQPFTRASQAFRIDADTRRLRVRARDSRHGYGGAEIVIDIAPEPH